MEERLFENDKTEFKSALNEKLERSVVAFLNSKTGGDIYIGIADDGTSIGIENLDKTLLAISDRSIFNLSENFLEVVFPFEEDYLKIINWTETETTPKVTPPVTDQVTDQVTQMIIIFETEAESANEIMLKLSLHHKHSFRTNYINPAIMLNLIEMTVPGKPNSRMQKYRLTKKGIELKKQLIEMKKKY